MDDNGITTMVLQQQITMDNNRYQWIAMVNNGKLSAVKHPREPRNC